MKKIISTLIIAIFCFANIANATTQNEGKEKNISNVNISIGDWKINGKVNGKIYISDDSKKDNRGRTKLGDNDIVTYSNGKINIEIAEEKLNETLAKWESALADCDIVFDVNNNNPTRITGNGNIISKDIPTIASYDAIKASRGIHVVMTEEEGDNITIQADDNVMPYVVVRKSGESLVITIDENIKSINSVNVKVTLPKNTVINELKTASAATIDIKPAIKSRTLSVDAASAGEVNIAMAEVDFFDADAAASAKISGTVKSNDCYADASSAAKIKLTLLAVQCKSNASSAAKIELNGEVATFEGDASSAAKIDAKGLNVLSFAEVDASSAAKITVNAIKKLDAEASSGATITYVPNNDLLEKKISQSSGGRVKSEF